MAKTNIQAKDLVYTRHYIDATMPVRQVSEFFKTYQPNFVAVVCDGAVAGLLGREKVLGLLGSQFGWALHGDKTVASVMDDDPLVINGLCDVVQLSREAMKRPEAKFFDDVIIATGAEYTGLLSVRDLIVAQFKDLERRLVEIDEQRAVLAETLAANLVDRSGAEGVALERKVQAVLEAARELEHSERKTERYAREQRRKEVTMNGRLENFSAVDLAQVLVQGAKTGRLHLIGLEAGREYHVYFERGRMVHGIGPFAEGEEAVCEALALHAGVFDFHFNELPHMRTIDTNPMALLMEACRRVDEGELVA